jgi:PAS domain S-box-containing protein
VSGAPRELSLSDLEPAELLLDALTDCAIYMVDLNGFVRSWNVGAAGLTGYTEAEIVGQHFARFFLSEDQANAIPARILHEARTAGRCETEGWRVRKDGSRFWAEGVVHPMRDTAGNLIGFAQIMRDVTQKKAAEEALSESERRFRLLVDGVLDYALYMLDPSGVITNWNAGAQRLKGYTAEEIVGQHFSRFYTREDRAAGLPLRVLEAAAREGRYEAEGWRIRKDGSRFWASVVVDAIRDDRGDLVGYAKITRDITERRAAQEALRDSERQFRLLVNSVTDYALYMLDLNGVITSWNAGAARIKGYTADEIIGQHFSRFYTEQDRSKGMPAHALYAAAQEGRYETEGWRVRKDGSLFWANAIIDAIKDETGTLIGYAKITRDITERRDAQLALENARTQRDRAQRMEVLGQLTGGVAHDFNNLLMVVSGNIERLKAAATNDPRGLRAAEAVERAIIQGASLTRQLLTFARRQVLRPEVTELGPLVEAMKAMLTTSMGASTLAVSIPPALWTAEVDKSELELALLNLVLNARDATPKGGIVTITAENVTLKRGDDVEGLEGEFVAVTVADTGCGIAPDVLPKVFDPFFTTKDVDKGSGLGLSQVHGFAHQSGGSVVIASELGRGTRVTLYLPRTGKETKALAASPALELPHSGSVLLVEDNPEVSEATKELLVQLGYTVHTVPNAELGLEAVEHHDFNLVVSDIVMAGEMNGVALARAIREKTPDLPLLLVTGYTSVPERAEHNFVVLRKPYRLADLSRAISIAMAGGPEHQPNNLVRLSDARTRSAGAKRDEG